MINIWCKSIINELLYAFVLWWLSRCSSVPFPIYRVRPFFQSTVCAQKTHHKNKFGIFPKKGVKKIVNATWDKFRYGINVLIGQNPHFKVAIFDVFVIDYCSQIADRMRFPREHSGSTELRSWRPRGSSAPTMSRSMTSIATEFMTLSEIWPVQFLVCPGHNW